MGKDSMRSRHKMGNDMEVLVQEVSGLGFARLVTADFDGW